jgi:hypothetical protein
MQSGRSWRDVLLSSTELKKKSNWLTFRHSRWRQHIPPKHQETSTRFHSITSQNMVFFIVTTVGTTNLTMEGLTVKIVSRHRNYQTFLLSFNTGIC